MLAELATSNKQVSDFLLDPAIYDTLEKIATTYGLPAERVEEFFDLTEAIMDGHIALADMPAVIAEAFGLPEDKAMLVASDVAGHRLLPLANFLPGVEQRITEWGGHLADYPVVRIAKQKTSAPAFAAQILERTNITLAEAAAKRLGFLLWELARNKRTPQQFHEFLSRRTNAGGLGLESDVADKLFLQAMQEKDTIELVDEDALAPHAVTRKKFVRAPEPAPVAAQPEADAAELAAAQKKATKAVKKAAKDPKEALAEAVAVAVSSAKPILGEASISEKLFADVAEKAIRGLRDIYQTRDVLEEGNKLSGTTLTSLLAAIKQGIDKYHETQSSSDLSAYSPPFDSAQGRQPTAQVRDTDVLDRKYAKLTKERPSESVEPMMPGARVSAARSSHEELTGQAARLGLSETAAERPAPARAELTVGSVPLASGNGQRKVVDVVSAHRLMGPVEQLGAMTPADFRRLSTNAAEAAQRIEDLIGSLTSTSYEERVRGIEAWRQSPLNQLYLTMAEEALAQGLSIPEIGSRRRASGQESLSPAEIKAITGLNARVRF